MSEALRYALQYYRFNSFAISYNNSLSSETVRGAAMALVEAMEETTVEEAMEVDTEVDMGVEALTTGA